MTYPSVRPARFLSRPNRFAAVVELAGPGLPGRQETVHVKNTGRCRELLVPGCRVWLAEGLSPGRKTRYDLIAVEKVRSGRPPLFVNMDAQAPNKVFAEWLLAGKGEARGLPRPGRLRPETTWGNSRFDFYWELSEGASPRRGFIEVKGCTLEEDGHARFPDAPTVRGVKHLRELTACRQAGYEAAVCFVIQMTGMRCFSPNDCTHPEFGQALRDAAQAGVLVLAVECAAGPDRLEMTDPVPVIL